MANHKRIDEVIRRIEEFHQLQPEPAAAVMPAARPGFNITTRAMALRMLRRNENAAHVAAALGVTRGEVELLVRVQKMAAGR